MARACAIVQHTQGGRTGVPASLFSLCCSVLMVLFISSSPLARVCGSLSRCFSTCELHRQTALRMLAEGAGLHMPPRTITRDGSQQHKWTECGAASLVLSRR